MYRVNFGVRCGICRRNLRADHPQIKGAHVACAADAGIWKPTCRHCLDDPPLGHTCPRCSVKSPPSIRQSYGVG